MSIETTKVPPSKNSNKEKSEIFLDAIVCDDWMDYDDDDVSKDENIQCSTSELSSEGVTEEILPKNGSPCSEVPNTFASPKSKKRKLPGFEEQLKHLNYDIMYMNFTKLLLFLESSNKELTFPFTLQIYEEFFNMIVPDISMLKSSSFDAKYRDICDKIIEAASGYLLTCVHEYRTEFQKSVMVIKKERNNMMNQSEKETSSFSHSTESVVPSSQTSTKVNTRILRKSPSPATISRGFKVHFLHTTRAFIKDDLTKIKEFPELSLDQAHFMHMSLEIEKIPKQKAAGTAVNSTQPAENSNQIMNLKTDVSKPGARPDVAEPWFAKPEVVRLIPVKTRVHVTKRMLKKQIKSENELIFLKRLPPNFISDALNSIHEFLMDDERVKLVFVPNTVCELDFYRKCLDWCKISYNATKFGEECKEIHYQISVLLFRIKLKVTKGSANKINETTGIKEVTYLKVHQKYANFGTVQSAPKKKKFNIQNALELAATDNIQLASVVNLNQSLRNKKKDKKLKKAKLNKAKNSAVASSGSSSKQATKTWADESSSSCSSRGTSQDRSNAAKVQHVAKRPANEISQNAQAAFQETLRIRRGEHNMVYAMNRKEQLKEALSVPVQSDKAMRMMRGMGWSGGALGARGNGITEPLMPELDLARRAGLGHSRYSQPETITKKPNQSKTAPTWVSERSNATTEANETENDVIVQMTQQLLLENRTFDTIMNTTELPKPTKSNIKLPIPTASNVKLSKPTTSNVELSKPTTSNVELSKPTTSNVEPSKPTTSNVELRKTIISNANLHFRQEILQSILDLLNADATCKTITYEKRIPDKGRKFVRTAVVVLKSKKLNCGIFLREELDICREIQDKYKTLPQFFVDAWISFDYKTIELKKKLLTDFEIPIQQEISIPSVRANTEIITEKNIQSYIISSGSHTDSLKAYEGLKFRVLFLLNILNFVKSFNEEVEVTFNKVLALKQKTYIQNVVDEVNMRIQFGSSPAEAKLCVEIKNHVKDAFLGAMFNHQYTSVTLNKYFRFKRLNRPDNAVKRTSQTSVNLDCFSSETFSEPKLSTDEPTDKENNNKVAEYDNEVAEDDSEVAEDNNTYENNAEAVLGLEVNESDPYDSDDSSIEEYNNSNFTNKVPKLLPGEEGVNISDFLYLYDKEKTNNTDIKNKGKINNDSATKGNSNVTENRSIKNNIGNGNIVIDNNDNQVIDMKRDSGITKNTEAILMAEEEKDIDTNVVKTFVFDDFTEEVIKSREMTFDIKKEFNSSDNVKDSEPNDQPIKDSDIVVANDNIDKMTDTVLLNTEDPIEQDVINIKKSNSNNDCTDIMAKDEIKNISEYLSKNAKDIKEDTDVTMKEIDCEPIEVISGKEESLVEINKEEKGKVINKVESMTRINKGESIAGIKKGESIEVTNIVESSTDVEVAQIEGANSINPSNDQNVKSDNNLEIKTNCDIISKENIVLGKDNCDTLSLGLRHVNSVGTETDGLNKEHSEIKNVRIVHIQHPIIRLTKPKVLEIQRHISNSLMLTTQLPLLKCHGVHNGTIIYTCHNKSTYDWLQNTLNVASNVKVLNTNEVTKMSLKVHGFFDFDSKYLFRMIELYNQEISTRDWVVEKTEKDGDDVIFIVRMDKFSINYIQSSNFALCAGIDEVQFSFIWE